MTRISNRVLGLVVAGAACAGCASERPVLERGWLGGRFADVVTHRTFAAVAAPGLTSGTVFGTPDGVTETTGALVVIAPEGTPLAAAGLAPGDLILGAGEKLVPSGDSLRAFAQESAPGATLTLRYWRAGDVHTADVIVGRESYQRFRTLSIGLGLSSALDLWPFDGTFNVLGLVRLEQFPDAPDRSGPEADYLRAAFPGREPEVGPGSGWQFFVIPLGVGARDHVLRQER